MLSSEYSILLIDDDADVLDAYTQLLEQSGYRVFACNNPFEAQAWIQPDWPGIVLSDVCMPGCSGIDLMMLFHQDDQQIPILLITGHGDVPMAVDAVKKGAWDFCKNRLIPANCFLWLKRRYASVNQSLRVVSIANRRCRWS